MFAKGRCPEDVVLIEFPFRLTLRCTFALIDNHHMIQQQPVHHSMRVEEDRCVNQVAKGNHPI